MPHPNAKLSLAARFWQKVLIIEDATSCWPWIGATDGQQGYGRIKIPGTSRQMPAHVLAWEIMNGPVPEGFFILHTCDIKPCCRNDGPQSHLYAGTHEDNMRDARERERHPSHSNGRWARTTRHTARGERCGRARLVNEQYEEVHMLYSTGIWSYRALATRYGVTAQAIYYILKHQKPLNPLIPLST
jgi:HNH endonuclease